MRKAIIVLTTDADTGYLIRPDVSAPGGGPEGALTRAQGKAVVDWLAPTLEPHLGSRMTAEDMATLKDAMDRRLAEGAWPGRGQVEVEVRVSPGI